MVGVSFKDGIWSSAPRPDMTRSWSAWDRSDRTWDPDRLRKIGWESTARIFFGKSNVKYQASAPVPIWHTISVLGELPMFRIPRLFFIIYDVNSSNFKICCWKICSNNYIIYNIYCHIFCIFSYIFSVCSPYFLHFSPMTSAKWSKPGHVLLRLGGGPGIPPQRATASFCLFFWVRFFY